MRMKPGWNLRLASMMLLVGALCFGIVAVRPKDAQARLLYALAAAINVCGAAVLFRKSRTHDKTST